MGCFSKGKTRPAYVLCRCASNQKCFLFIKNVCRGEQTQLGLVYMEVVHFFPAYQMEPDIPSMEKQKGPTSPTSSPTRSSSSSISCSRKSCHLPWQFVLLLNCPYFLDTQPESPRLQFVATGTSSFHRGSWEQSFFLPYENPSGI